MKCFIYKLSVQLERAKDRLLDSKYRIIWLEGLQVLYEKNHHDLAFFVCLFL